MRQASNKAKHGKTAKPVASTTPHVCRPAAAPAVPPPAVRGSTSAKTATAAVSAKDPEQLSMRELERQLAAMGVDYSDAIDKEELVELYQAHVSTR